MTVKSHRIAQRGWVVNTHVLGALKRASMAGRGMYETLC